MNLLDRRGVDFPGSPKIFATRKRFPYLEPVMRRVSKNAARLGRVLEKLDILIVEIGGRCFATSYRLIDCDLRELMMGITAQCLPMGIG